jgi:nicotinate dehydrogenase subunit B
MVATSTRRHFLQGSGALVIAFALPSAPSSAQTASRLPGNLQSNRMLDAWLAIQPTGKVTIYTGKIELGQGIGTAIAQIAADELGVDLARIEIVTGDTARTPNEGQTSGSQSVEYSGTAVRFACAEARELVLAAGARKLGVAASTLSVSDGTVRAPGGATTTYWELVGDVDLKREATASATPRPASEHRYVGRSVPRLDIPKKFTGGAAYVQDVRLPGMVFGRVVRPPSAGAQLVSFDESAVKAMPGIVAIVRDGDFLAVAAEREEQAIRARAALKSSAVWKESPSLPPEGAGLYEAMLRSDVPVQVVSEKGVDVTVSAAKSLTATYTKPYTCHGSIGPSCAVAQWTDGKLRVWTHSQGVFPLRADLAKVFGVEPKQIRCTHVEGSGCYGHNGADDVALDAALVARAVGGRAVKLQWMRDDEFGSEPYGSPMVVKMGGTLDAAGRVADWSHELWSYPHNRRPGYDDGVNVLAAWHLAVPIKAAKAVDVPQPAGGADRNSIPLYAFPKHRVTKHHIVDSPLRTSALRTLGAYGNVFALESFMDEMALTAGADPVDFRLRHLQDPRGRAVIEAAAAKAGWSANTGGDGSRGRGIAFAKYKNLACYCAIVADVAIDRSTGVLSVVRMTAAVDAGQIVSPDGVINQIEGGIIQSTSWTLKEALRFDRTRVVTSSWANYPILRFEEVPRVDVVLIDRPDMPFLGVGEGSTGPAAAAIANALANATGKRLRDLPFTPDRVKAALTA